MLPMMKKGWWVSVLDGARRAEALNIMFRSISRLTIRN